MLPSEGRLPLGVSQGTQDSFAQIDWPENEDHWLASTPLASLDQAFVRERLPQPRGRVADLGCGAGRITLELARRGFEVVAVDLSQPMLNHVGAMAEREGLRVDRRRLNLVDLSTMETGSCSDAICLFSTLGMVRGGANRLRAMKEMHRILAPGGQLLLHAHQFWWNLRHPGGLKWMTEHFYKAMILGSTELGDRYAFYRGVPNFYLHSFRAGELRGLLRSAGFEIRVWRTLRGDGSRPLAAKWCFPALRAGGWLISAEKRAENGSRMGEPDDCDTDNLFTCQ